MKNLTDKNQIVNQLFDNVSQFIKYKIGAEPPKKKKDNTGLLVSATILGVLAGVGAGFLFATESGAATREKLNKLIQDATKQISNYTSEEIEKLNEIAKEQIENLKKMKS